MTTRTRPTGTRGAETRASLLRAAVSVIERDGLAALTTRSVAAEAGLPHGTVHYWFADKADLLAGALDVLLSDVRAAITEDQTVTDLGDRLRAVQERFASISEGRHIGLFELTLHAARAPEHATLGIQQYQDYMNAAEVGIAPWGDAAETTLPGGATALATLAVAVLDGLGLASLAHRDQSELVAARELFIHLLVETLGKGAPATDHPTLG